jgi:hypothetical protein
MTGENLYGLTFTGWVPAISGMVWSHDLLGSNP